MLTCKINNKRYVGASVSVGNRLTTHFGRDARKYQNSALYSDIRLYGLDGFSCALLEECNREEILEREQHYYDILQPEYNVVRPAKCNFVYDSIRQRSIAVSQDIEHIAKRKKLFNTPEYKSYFQRVHTEKMRAVEAFQDGISVGKFFSLQECARWITENTNFSGVNKASKIKAVCDGERPRAYGYTFKYLYEPVETNCSASIDTVREAVRQRNSA